MRPRTLITMLIAGVIAAVIGISLSFTGHAATPQTSAACSTSALKGTCGPYVDPALNGTTSNTYVDNNVNSAIDHSPARFLKYDIFQRKPEYPAGQQRQLFAAALFQRLLRTYAGAVAEWTPDRFKVLPLRADPEALQVTVHTQVTSERGPLVPVDFRMRQTAEGWKIFDVTVDGVSYMRVYHDDTDEEITQKGLDATIARLSASDPAAVKRMQPSNTRGAH